MKPETTKLAPISIGVRLPGKTRQRIAKQAAALSIPQSSFIRVLIHLAIEQIDKDPAILLKRPAEAVDLPEQ